MPRVAAATFTPGTPLVLQAVDAKGVVYRLYLPADALAKPARVRLEPLRRAVAIGKPHGLGVRLLPEGLRLRAPGSLTVDGVSGRDALVSYQAARGSWALLDGGATEGTYVIGHFSVDGTTDPATAAAAQSAYAAAGGAMRDAMAWLARACLLGDQGACDPEQAMGEDKLLWDAIRTQVAALARDSVHGVCASGVDDERLAFAQVATTTAVRAGVISSAEALALIQPVYLLCAIRHEEAGNRGCRAAEKVQDGPARAAARGFIVRATKLAALAGQSGQALIQQLYDDDLPGCLGYHVDFPQPHAPPDSVTAFTCGDTFAGVVWGGSWFGTFVQGSTEYEHHFQVAVPGDGSQVDFLPAVGGLIQQTFRVAATPARALPASLVFHDDRTPMAPAPPLNFTLTAPVQAGTKGYGCAPR